MLVFILPVFCANFIERFVTAVSNFVGEIFTNIRATEIGFSRKSSAPLNAPLRIKVNGSLLNGIL